MADNDIPSSTNPSSDVPSAPDEVGRLMNEYNVGGADKPAVEPAAAPAEQVDQASEQAAAQATEQVTAPLPEPEATAVTEAAPAAAPAPAPAAATTPAPATEPAPAATPAPATATPAPAATIVESASATSDSASNRTGSSPYIIFAVGVLVLALLTASVGGCMSAIFSGMFSYVDNGYGYGYGSGSGNGGSNNNGNSDSSNRNSGSGNSGSGNSGSSDSYSNGSPSRSTSLTTELALDYNLYLYSYDLDDGVAAEDYSSAQATVINYARQLVNIDADSTRLMVGYLNAAQADNPKALASAQELVEKTEADLAKLELPTDITGDKADAVTKSLKSATEKTTKRWEAIAKIVALIQEPSGHTMGDLYDEDDNSDEALVDAGSELSKALVTSASSK